MIFIEHWVDIVGLLLVVGGIGLLFHFLQNEGRSAERQVSEKPALFLEFTGKQMFVRPQRSKLVPVSRKNGESVFPAPKPKAAAIIQRLHEELVLVKMLYLATARDCGRALRRHSQRGPIRMKGAGRHIRAAHARLVTAGRVRLAVIMRALMDGDRGIRSNRRARHRALTGFKRIFEDLRLNLDIQGHRLDRGVQTQWKKCGVVMNRLADALLTESHQIRMRTQERWNNLIKRVPVRIWWRNAQIEVTQYRERVMADYRTLQQAAQGSIRRFWQANRPGEEKSSLRPRATSRPHPIVLGLTSSGTLKLRSRLEDEGASPYEQALSEPKGTRTVSKVTVRFIGTAQRHSRESAESKKAERMVKP